MQGPAAHVFRPSALKRYLSSRNWEDSTSPAVVRPRVLRLWLTAGILVVFGLLAWCVSVPVYVTGRAVMLDRVAPQDKSRVDAVVAVLVPSEDTPRTRSGQPVLLDVGTRGTRMAGTLRKAAHDTFDWMDPGSPRSQFRDSAGGNLIPVGSVALTSEDAAAIREFGFRGMPVRVRVGGAKAVSYLPIIGRFFANLPAPGSLHSGSRSARGTGARIPQTESQ